VHVSNEHTRYAVITKQQARVHPMTPGSDSEILLYNSVIITAGLQHEDCIVKITARRHRGKEQEQQAELQKGKCILEQHISLSLCQVRVHLFVASLVLSCTCNLTSGSIDST
jgi:hypothetical protein